MKDILLFFTITLVLFSCGGDSSSKPKMQETFADFLCCTESAGRFMKITFEFDSSYCDSGTYHALMVYMDSAERKEYSDSGNFIRKHEKESDNIIPVIYLKSQGAGMPCQKFYQYDNCLSGCLDENYYAAPGHSHKLYRMVNANDRAFTWKGLYFQQDGRYYFKPCSKDTIMELFTGAVAVSDFSNEFVYKIQKMDMKGYFPLGMEATMIPMLVKTENGLEKRMRLMTIQQIIYRHTCEEAF